MLYGCEAWSLMLKEECKLRVFENRIIRRIFGPKMRMGSGEGPTIRNFIVCTVCLIYILWLTAPKGATSVN